jgi:hypothetical protein
MKRAVTSLIIAAAALAAGPVLRAGGNGNPDIVPVTYYGDNNLKDYYQAGVLKKFADSTTALFYYKSISLDEAAGVYRIKNQSLQDKYNLQPGEPFGGQTVGAFCSGVLVGDDLVLTAGHCFAPDDRGAPCGRVFFVFGYALNSAGETPSSFPKENVYTCGSVIAQRVMDAPDNGAPGHNFTCSNGSCSRAAIGADGPDYALVRLDRKVAGRYPLAISRVQVAKGTKVGVIGYPSGMPVKVQEEGANVRSVSPSGYFVSNLDTFKGNSGSPVFDMSTLKIVGLLSRGGVDFVYTSGSSQIKDPGNPGYYAPGRANVEPQDGGRGEDATLASEFQDLIPQTQMERYLNVRAQQQGRQEQPKVVPAVYYPGRDGGPQAVPAVYYVPDPVPQPISI